MNFPLNLGRNHHEQQDPKRLSFFYSISQAEKACIYFSSDSGTNSNLPDLAGLSTDEFSKATNSWATSLLFLGYPDGLLLLYSTLSLFQKRY